VSEIARNTYEYAGGGKIDFRVESETRPQILLIEVSDTGPGIADVDAILSGTYKSPTGMGIGLIGARRLVDQLDIKSSPVKGTVVRLKKILPSTAPRLTAREVAEMTRAIDATTPRSPFEEVQRQNRELISALDELKNRGDELVDLNHELEDTNRGVVALYAELDEKADHLRRADEIKTRFLSNMSHEFRTPVNSILALSRMLLDDSDLPLAEEQQRQVRFIRKAAEDLSELVNDLLDLAKVEAGKVTVHPALFEVSDLFGALRGMLRPLLVNESVNLIFDEPEGVSALQTDEAKVSQILRNFISNALKFTERGEIRVSARLNESRDCVVFSVSDAGIGIAPEDQERIFQEFSQLDHPIQKRVKGTGLGLPLCRRLAELLGGHLEVDSTPGVGSKFSAIIPLIYAHNHANHPGARWDIDPGRTPILVIEDAPESVMLYEKYLKGSGYQVIAASTLQRAREALQAFRPRVIILDIVLWGEQTWSFLAQTKQSPETTDIPVVVVTTSTDESKAVLLGADAYATKPVSRDWLLDTLHDLTGQEIRARTLIVDDSEVARYLLRQSLEPFPLRIAEAASGSDAIRAARADRPQLIFLDLVMPDATGFEVVEQLKADPETADIPIVIVTAKELAERERIWLEERTLAVLSKAAAANPQEVRATLSNLLLRAGVGA
jgi:signal transduction histidine kinase/DNA-binding response OmpR family regulator